MEVCYSMVPENTWFIILSYWEICSANFELGNPVFLSELANYWWSLIHISLKTIYVTFRGTVGVQSS